MAWLLAVFSPETHAAFSRSDRRVMGFKERHWNAARKIGAGDRLLCYLTGRSCWVGMLEVAGAAYEDATPVFAERDDPFRVRVPVVPVVWLPAERGVEIREDAVWRGLSFTREHEKRSSRWTGSLRTPLSVVKAEDGALLERVLRERERAA